MSVKSFILVFHQSSPEHELFIHSVATMLGTSVKSNATQYNSSAINYIFATIIISFDIELVAAAASDVLLTRGGEEYSKYNSTVSTINVKLECVPH